MASRVPPCLCMLPAKNSTQGWMMKVAAGYDFFGDVALSDLRLGTSLVGRVSPSSRGSYFPLCHRASCCEICRQSGRISRGAPALHARLAVDIIRGYSFELAGKSYLCSPEIGGAHHGVIRLRFAVRDDRISVRHQMQVSDRCLSGSPRLGSILRPMYRR